MPVLVGGKFSVGVAVLSTFEERQCFISGDIKELSMVEHFSSSYSVLENVVEFAVYIQLTPR